MSDDRKATAKQLYLEKGMTHGAIADQLGVSRRTVERWASDDGWGELKRANVVAFEKPVNREPAPRRQRRDIDENEIVDTAICDLSTAMASCETDSRSLGSIAGALVRLLEYRRKIQPRTAAELAEMAIALEIPPEQFATALREAWRLRA